MNLVEPIKSLNEQILRIQNEANSAIKLLEDARQQLEKLNTVCIRCGRTTKVVGTYVAGQHEERSCANCARNGETDLKHTKHGFKCYKKDMTW